MELINFTLTEHILEDKITAATQIALAKTETKIQNDIAKKTKDLRKHMDQEFRKSQIAISGMQTDINATNKSIIRQSVEINEMNNLAGSFGDRSHSAMMTQTSFGSSNDMNSF